MYIREERKIYEIHKKFLLLRMTFAVKDTKAANGNMLGELLTKYFERYFATEETVVVVHDAIRSQRSIRNLINDLYLQQK